MRDADLLKQEILSKVVQYYSKVHKPIQEQTFIPEKSRINYGGRVFDENELVNLIDSSLDFWLTHGKYSNEFEKKLSGYLGVKSALFVNSGSSANLLAFMALTSPLLNERRIKRGDEVITVAAAFPTTIAPIVQYGAVPVFVDIELDTCNINISFLKQALSHKTKAVMLAHILGNPFDITQVKAFCEKHNLWLIEDNCDALGSRINGQLTGTFGDIGTSSFYPAHHITTGEGGAVYTSNQLLKKIMLSMRDWGRDCWCASGKDNTCGNRFTTQFGSLPKGYDHKYIYSQFGYNLKATDLQASIGVAQLDKINQFILARQHNFTTLSKNLQDVQEFIQLPVSFENAEPSWFGFLIQVKQKSPFTRDDLAQYLESKNIQTRNLFSGNIVRHPLFEALEPQKDYRIVDTLTNTDKAMNNALWIGVYPAMTQKMLKYMADSIFSFVRNRVSQ